MKNQLAETAVKERPILFSTPMIQAIRNGTKTQTRRAIKGADGVVKMSEKGRVLTMGQWGFKCPFGQVGDTLWVRETIKRTKFGGLWSDVFDSAEYRVDYLAGGMGTYRMCSGEMKKKFKNKIVPSIHIFKHESRLSLEITDIRVERLQDISTPDAKAEGIAKSTIVPYGWRNYVNPALIFDEQKWYGGEAAANLSFESLWTSINGADSWEKNPWVWAITFKVLEGGAS